MTLANGNEVEMKMATVKAHPVYDDNRLITRIGVSVVPDSTWPKAILTALAARPTCEARYTGQRKAQLSDVADSVQRRLEAVEELAHRAGDGVDGAGIQPERPVRVAPRPAGAGQRALGGRPRRGGA